MNRTFLYVIVITLVATTAAPAQSTVAMPVDVNQQHQTIDGFGALVSEWNMSVHSDQNLINQLVRDLGVSIMRFLAIAEFEATNENTDVSTLALSSFNTGGDFGTQMSLITKFEAAAQGDLRVDKYFVSPLSPPAFMKTNASTVGGKLRTDMYGEYAEYLAAYCQAVRDETGVDLYAISLENEPEWEQWYSSCVIEPEEMRDLMTVVGPRMASEGVSSTRLMWSETLLTQNWGPYLGYMMQDADAAQYAGIYAVHSYDDGVNPGEPGVTRWQQIHSAMTNFPQLDLWMSETSGYENTWEGALTMARAIHASLKFGHVNAWVWHNPNSTNTNHHQEALMINGEPKKHYYIAKQFYRWIRPGAVMVDIDDTGDSDVGATAFIHPDDRSLTIVCINTADSPRTVSLGGSPAATYDTYRTSATEDCVSLGPSSNSVTLAASSVTTLVASDVPLATGRREVAARRHTVLYDGAGTGRSYTASGRQLIAAKTSGIALTKTSTGRVTVGVRIDRRCKAKAE